jgi:hypothetical protein
LKKAGLFAISGALGPARHEMEIGAHDIIVGRKGHSSMKGLLLI